MDWREHPVTAAQLRFLERLGSTAKPTTKGTASDVIDQLLNGRVQRKHNPTMKLHIVRDANQIVDDAVERVKRELDHANQTSRATQTKAHAEATPPTRMLRLFRPDPAVCEAGGRDDHLMPGSDRGPAQAGSGEMVGEPTQENPFRGANENDRQSRSPEHYHNHGNTNPISQEEI